MRLGLMEENKDTTAWGGVSVVMGLIMFPAGELERQFIVIVVFPMMGWLSVYLFKKLVLHVEGKIKGWWNRRKAKRLTE